eukprot:73064-Chlamydomonas_euryale.AAC.3
MLGCGLACSRDAAWGSAMSKAAVEFTRRYDMLDTRLRAARAAGCATRGRLVDRLVVAQLMLDDARVRLERLRGARPAAYGGNSSGAQEREAADADDAPAAAATKTEPMDIEKPAAAVAAMPAAPVEAKPLVQQPQHVRQDAMDRSMDGGGAAAAGLELRPLGDGVVVKTELAAAAAAAVGGAASGASPVRVASAPAAVKQEPSSASDAPAGAAAHSTPHAVSAAAPKKEEPLPSQQQLDAPSLGGGLGDFGGFNVSARHTTFTLPSHYCHTTVTPSLLH